MHRLVQRRLTTAAYPLRSDAKLPMFFCEVSDVEDACCPMMHLPPGCDSFETSLEKLARKDLPKNPHALHGALRRVGFEPHVRPLQHLVFKYKFQTRRERILRKVFRPFINDAIAEEAIISAKGKIEWMKAMERFQACQRNGYNILQFPKEHPPEPICVSLEGLPWHRKLARLVAWKHCNCSINEEASKIKRDNERYRCNLMDIRANEAPRYNKSHLPMDNPPAHMPWFEELVQKVAPTVVNVSVTENVYGEFVTNNIGSGVIIDANGIILTAYDLVASQWWFFERQWTPKGQIMVGLQDGRRFAANLAAANKDLGIAVLKISSKDQFPAAVAGKSYIINDDELIINVEWPPTESNSVVGLIGSGPYDRIHLRHGGYTYIFPTNKDSFGGPIVNCYGHVLGISQKKLTKDAGSIFAAPVENAMKMMEKLKIT